MTPTHVATNLWGAGLLASGLALCAVGVAQAQPRRAAVDAERPPAIPPRDRIKRIGCTIQQWTDLGGGALVTPGVALQTRVRVGFRGAFFLGTCNFGLYAAGHAAPSPLADGDRAWTYLEVGARVRVLGPDDDIQGARLMASVGALSGRLEEGAWPVSVRVAPRGEYRWSPGFMLWAELGLVASLQHASGDLSVGLSFNWVHYELR